MFSSQNTYKTEEERRCYERVEKVLKNVEKINQSKKEAGLSNREIKKIFILLINKITWPGGCVFINIAKYKFKTFSEH